MASKHKPSTAYFITALVALLLVCSAGTAHGQRRRAPVQQTTSSPRQLLERADFYYRSDDTSDAADRLYKQIVGSFPTHPEAGYAQYNRGSYWQRKFYILKAKTGIENPTALREAEGQFYDFLADFGSSPQHTGLTADAHFFLALVYLQQGKPANAIGWLNLLSKAGERDPQVYINKVVWSRDAIDLLDRNVSSRGLAQETTRLIQKNPSFTQVVSGVKSWCRKQ